MSLRLDRDRNHLRFRTGSHWCLFTKMKHVCIYKHKWNIKKRSAFLKQRATTTRYTACRTHLFGELRHDIIWLDISFGHADVSMYLQPSPLITHETNIINHQIITNQPTWLIPESPGSTCSGLKELLQNLTAWPEKLSIWWYCWDFLESWNPPATTWQPKPKESGDNTAPKKTRNGKKHVVLPGIRIKRCQRLLLNCSGQKRNSLFQDKGIILTLGQRSVSGGSATSIYNPTCLIITGHKPPRRKNMKWNHHFNSFISIKALKFPFNMVRNLWGFMVDTVLVSPGQDICWTNSKEANVWWFPTVHHHLFLENPLRSLCFADTLFLLHMMFCFFWPLMQLSTILKDMAEGQTLQKWMAFVPSNIKYLGCFLQRLFKLLGPTMKFPTTPTGAKGWKKHLSITSNHRFKMIFPEVKFRRVSQHRVVVPASLHQFSVMFLFMCNECQ